MKFGFILLNLLYFLSALENSNKSEIIPKELFHGKIQNDTWKIGKFHEYYLDISKYELNEENVLEIYLKNEILDLGLINLYLLSTDISDTELIKNGTIKPNPEKDIYPLNKNNIKYEHINYEYYLFIPFKKTSASKKFLIISIKNIIKTDIEALIYISRRIPIININKKNQDSAFLYSKEIEVKDDIRFYYKIDLRKVDLIKNNVYIFIKKIENNDRVLEVNYYCDFSLESSEYDVFIIEKNTHNFSYILMGIKRSIYYKKGKYVNISIRIDDNAFYLIKNKYRENVKLYIQDIKCDKNIFVIEDYLGDNVHYYENYKFLSNFKLYGNYTIKYYNSIKDLDFEKFDKEHDKAKIDYSSPLKGYVNVYIIKCIFPSAFYFEIFTQDNFPDHVNVGDSIKTILYPDVGYYREIFIENSNYFDIYKVHVEILDNAPENRSLNCKFPYFKQKEYITIKEPEKYHSEIFYLGPYETSFSIGSYEYMLLNYYLTSNHLFHNIIEGKTKIDKSISNTALKIKKDIYFDFIKIKIKCETNIKGYYELKLINNKDIEDESNAVMVGLPQVAMPFSSLVHLNISNPYNKFDQISSFDEKDNFYYLLFSFEIKDDNPIYLDIEYIHNDQNITLHSIKSEIIIPQTEYEFFSYGGDYKTKDKILFNINKCNNLANFTLVNYYENKENIISKVPIVEPHQTILIDNYHYKGKFIITKESGKEQELNESLIFPANYYHKGDILLNFFSIESSKLKEIKFNNDFSISYEEETWDNITFKWNHYAFRESNNNKINIPTNYSIYVLPKNSVVNTICQLHLIPSNKSVINSNEVAIELKEGEYKISIIAKIIDNDIPFEIRYDTLELKVVKKMNLILIIFLGVFGLAFILFILFIIFWKKKIFMFKKRRDLEINGEDDIADSVDNIMKENSEEEEEEADDDESSKNTLAKKLIEMIDK